MEARREELRQQQEAANRNSAGVYVTRALVHAAPEDEVEPHKRLSRSDILSKWTKPPVKPSAEPPPLMKRAPVITAEAVIQTADPFPIDKSTGSVLVVAAAAQCDAQSLSSECDERCCSGEECGSAEECSACSCCSCECCCSSSVSSETTTTPRQSKTAGRQVHPPGPEPIPLSLVKQRKMEFERMRILEEQESRLKELVRRDSKMGSTEQQQPADTPPSPDGQGWLALARKARQLEDRWNRVNRRSPASPLLYEPVQVASARNTRKSDNGKRSNRNRNRSKQRSRIIQQLRNKMRENLAAESMDPRDRQRRHLELKELLSDAMHAGTQTLSNINLGLIYVPMEQQQDGPGTAGGGAGSHRGTLMALKAGRSCLAGSDKPMAKSSSAAAAPATELGEHEEENEDLFASIDTLIFEPKTTSGSSGGEGSTIKSAEPREVEKRIAQQFDYLNDSQYGSCLEEEEEEEEEEEKGKEKEDSGSDSEEDGSRGSLAGSKNGRLAAAAAATAAHPPSPAATSGTEAGAAGRTASCAAAASCDASASNHDDDDDDDISLASFSSVIYQGSKLLADAERQAAKAQSTADADAAAQLTSATMDSEHYTNVDTDASWDYYPEGDGAASDGGKRHSSSRHKKSGPDPLLVGNLRKKPPELDGQEEADETARLLESLRMAEDAHLSTSLRLIFPPSSLSTASPDEPNNFIQLMNQCSRKMSRSEDDESDGRKSSSTRSPPAPDSGFLSLPELTVESRENRPITGPTARYGPGLRKRDTMIRELKTKLRDKFQPPSEEEEEDDGELGQDPRAGQMVTRVPSSNPPTDPPPPIPPSTPPPPLVQAVQALVGGSGKKNSPALNKLESILTSFASLAQMKGHGRIYRTAGQPQSLPANYSSPGPAYDVPCNSLAAAAVEGPVHSTGYPHHLMYSTPRRQRLYESSMSEPTTIYDPSLPEDIPAHHYHQPDEYPLPMELLLLHERHQHRSLNLERLRGNPYQHEGLYNISEPLEERPHAARKNKRRARRRRIEGAETAEAEEASWSDLESLIFAEPGGAGFAQHSMPAIPSPGGIHPPNSRMTPYHQDEWLFWDQLHQWRQNPADQERWEAEKARRMLLWIHHIHKADTEAALTNLPQWWQVE